ncbi:biopolymer transporter ExbD [Pseudoalteromonas sp. MMG013]|uniref:Biopolymer transport protein ExbD n=1 Tax=Pseudoalteromonas aurantia 208 TaxID=1314867 RepID=A0ABR9EIN6_9GAMM|nr:MULTISPECIES: biopolymer transporter ExbD [Pseudoalteromonas]MBE0370607.1 biopolymer transport protein ExbD [Pseudoalteromonas aurantia 208]MBQ4845189.1 biopolymer transporter ExbD [Pseudoalteromonas sp. MMG005]MBQ4851844.1 biopolymer transporter ExbD [Pseudoalteromonas sp. MMG012]MBQ4860567.1 biopolymer transporter ExbD [Pseudoalteromonas sp. MMG013]
MKSSLDARTTEQESQDIDLAPLLDVVFILLIFFIVTTVFVKETGVEVDKPTAVSSQNLQKTVLLLAITSDGQVMYSGTNIGVAGIRSTLGHINDKDPRPLIIQADKTVTTELLVSVIDQAKLAGINNINLATVAGE